jgi:hypothetical protein
MSSEAVVVTIADCAFVARARVLGASLREVHPELRLHLLLLADRRPRRGVRLRREPFAEVRGLADPARSHLRMTAFRYAGRGAAAAVKATALRALLARGHRRVLFLDADTVVTDRLDRLLDPPSGAPIVLTPHLLEPAGTADARERERVLLRAGVLNAGAVSVAPGPAADAFLAWWEQRLRDHCIADPNNGIHLDQRWLDFAPGMFDGVELHRDPGVNVAYWNLHERPVRVERGRITAGGEPCRLLHASGYDVRRPDRLSVYAPDMRTADLGDAGRLASRYRDMLLAAGEERALRTASRYATYADGSPISDAAREAHRLLAGEAARFGDPFAVGPGSFREWFAAQSAT